MVIVQWLSTTNFFNHLQVKRFSVIYCYSQCIVTGEIYYGCGLVDTVLIMLIKIFLKIGSWTKDVKFSQNTY